MCLRLIHNEEEKQEFLDNITEEGIEVYKVVYIDREGEMWSACRHAFRYDGTMEEEKDFMLDASLGGKYRVGFHFFAEKTPAQQMCNYGNNILRRRPERQDGHYKIIACNIKKEWIVAVGKEHRYPQTDTILDDKYLDTVIVTKKAIFPDMNED